MLEESGDEAEQDAIVNQVLDEIGIDIKSQVFALQGFCPSNEQKLYHSILYVLAIKSPSTVDINWRAKRLEGKGHRRRCRENAR